MVKTEIMNVCVTVLRDTQELVTMTKCNNTCLTFVPLIYQQTNFNTLTNMLFESSFECLPQYFFYGCYATKESKVNDLGRDTMSFIEAATCLNW